MSKTIEQSELESSIDQYLGRRSGVSLVELSRDIPGFSANEMWGSSEQNIVIWVNMSPTAIAAMTQLITSAKIVATPTSALVYAFDGGALDLPIAKSIKRQYARPHWFPLVFAGNREASR